jgi:hypothetical protein
VSRPRPRPRPCRQSHPLRQFPLLRLLPLVPYDSRFWHFLFYCCNVMTRMETPFRLLV